MSAHVKVLALHYGIIHVFDERWVGSENYSPGHRPAVFVHKVLLEQPQSSVCACLWLLLHLTFYRRASTPPWRELACWGGGPGSRRWGLCRNGDLLALEKQPVVLGAHAGD